MNNVKIKRSVSTRRLSALILALILGIALVGCKTGEKESQSASQNDFLKDMSEGIKNRVSDNKDTSTMSEAEIAEYYAELVNRELKKIGKYSDAKFADERFNTLAHQYINACEIQLAATENYRSASLYNTMWNSGREIRSAIIVFFYENYDLNLTDEEIASYLSSSTDYSITVDSSGGNILDFFSDKDDVKLSHGDLTIEKFEGEITNYGSSDDYCELKYVVKNNSAYELNMVSVDCVILDANKNILTTRNATAWAAIPHGKTVICETSFSVTEYPNAKYVQIEYLSYDGDGDHVSHNISLTDSEVEKLTLVVD